MLKLSGGITKHLCDGHTPFYILEDKDLLSDEWTTFIGEQFKSQYSEYICPSCGDIHLKKDNVSDKILYGDCYKKT